MTKAELVAFLAQETDITKATAEKILNSFVAQVTKTLKKDGRFVVTGLGIFEVVKRKKRIARNPRTNEPAVVKAHKTVKFKISKRLKDAVN